MLSNKRDLRSFCLKFQEFKLARSLPTFHISSIPRRATKSSSSRFDIDTLSQSAAFTRLPLFTYSELSFHALNHQQTPHTNPPCSAFPFSLDLRRHFYSKKPFWLRKANLFSFLSSFNTNSTRFSDFFILKWAQ